MAGVAEKEPDIILHVQLQLLSKFPHGKYRQGEAVPAREFRCPKVKATVLPTLEATALCNLIEKSKSWNVLYFCTRIHLKESFIFKIVSDWVFKWRSQDFGKGGMMSSDSGNCPNWGSKGKKKKKKEENKGQHFRSRSKMPIFSFGQCIFSVRGGGAAAPQPPPPCLRPWSIAFQQRQIFQLSFNLFLWMTADFSVWQTCESFSIAHIFRSSFKCEKICFG